MNKANIDEIVALYSRILLSCRAQTVAASNGRIPLTRVQEDILTRLDEQEATNLRDLAAHMGVTAATTCSHVDKLCAKGLVLREPGIPDRREVRLRLSAQGALVKSSAVGLDPKLVSEVISKLKPEELKQALGGLRLLAGATNGVEPRQEALDEASSDLKQPALSEEETVEQRAARLTPIHFSDTAL